MEQIYNPVERASQEYFDSEVRISEDNHMKQSLTGSNFKRGRNQTIEKMRKSKSKAIAQSQTDL